MNYAIFEARPGLAVLLLSDAPKFTVVAANNDNLNLFGLKQEEVLGRSHFDLFTRYKEVPVFTPGENVRDSYEFIIENKIPHQHPLTVIMYLSGPGACLVLFFTSICISSPKIEVRSGCIHDCYGIEIY